MNAPPRTYRYAAYGSNLHPLRLQRRVPSARPLGIATLGAWQMRFHKKSDVDGSGKCSIFPGSEGVNFAIYEIDVGEKPILDAIEGLGSGYDEMTLCMAHFGDCQTYVARDEVVDADLLPMDWYRELVLAGCAFNHFPDQYVAAIAATPVIADPNPDRRRENWELVERLRGGG